MKVTLRPLTNNDLPMILSAWLRGAYHLCPAFRDMPKSLFYGIHEPNVKRIISLSDTLIACDPEDPSHILGFITFRDYKHFTVVHWLYVKQQFRGFKLARHLLSQTKAHERFTFTSHETIESQKFFNKLKIKNFHVPHFRHAEWHESELNNFLQVRSHNET